MKTIRFILLSCLMLLAAVNVQANDYLSFDANFRIHGVTIRKFLAS